MTHLSAAVREDLCWVDHKSDPKQYHGEIRPEVRAAVEAPHVGDERLEELEHHHGEDEELDGQPVDLVIVLDLARSVDPGEVIFVHTVLHDEEQQSWVRRVYKIRTVLHSSGLVLTEWTVAAWT